ncbi:MAG: GrpB family protein [Phycisphaerae bacterium]|nr:GrpB family protein [Gemmatimonadaceae bacterium]
MHGTFGHTTLGLENCTVRLVAYDSAWPRLFGEEAARIRTFLESGTELALEHMGSTAVPGLTAKPILDILGGYPQGARVEPFTAALVRAGYAHRGEQDIPGREFFRRGEPRSYHVHLAVKDGVFWRDQLAFRDALRTMPDVRDGYAALKLELAQKFPRDREAYIDGKGAFVRRVIDAVLCRNNSTRFSI